jgi:hypothetical protein
MGAGQQWHRLIASHPTSTQFSILGRGSAARAVLLNVYKAVATYRRVDQIKNDKRSKVFKDGAVTNPRAMGVHTKNKVAIFRSICSSYYIFYVDYFKFIRYHKEKKYFF